mgnify:FL=1
MRLSGHPYRSTCSILFTLALLLAWEFSSAGTLRERLVERRSTDQAQEVAIGEPSERLALAGGMRLLKDVPYANEGKQRMDVYLPRQPAGAPVIFMVHGGAWRLGDKDARAVVENKVARWVPQGFIFISTNYRLLPDTAPLEQAEDIARALATAQAKAASWGGDPTRFILMGHSAGAHLVALVATSPEIVRRAGAKPWLGSVLLDSAALDVVTIMQARHARFYDRAFGKDPAYWRAVSPVHGLSENTAPLLAVCSSQRSESCPQASRFVEKTTALGVRASVLQQDRSHQEINQQLGLANPYTDAVEVFMGSLSQ